MELKMACVFLLAAMCIFTSHISSVVSANNSYQTYIVHVNLPPPEVGVSGQLSSEDLETWYHSFLPSSGATPESNNHPSPSSRIVHTYRNVFTGFAAKLSPDEVKEMEKKPGFMYARPQKKYRLHTTHSPNFLGLHQTFVGDSSNYGKGVIIGVIDTGITPGHPSFNDRGMPPPPAKWKGKCELGGTLYSCNNKLIGARNFASRFPDPPIDDFGHGTHTASTAAGNFVSGANLFGQANGTASGIAPLAHLAIYKVGGYDSDVLAGMDVAIDDGVDVLSLSLGEEKPTPFYKDSIAIGAFSAVKRGIFVSCSAGNNGPDNASLSNEAPWILSVGASTTDRKIKATTLLGNGVAYDGESLYPPKGLPDLLPLVYGGFCWSESLEKVGVKGKVVLCENGGGDGQTVKDADGAGMIGMNDEADGYYTEPLPHVLPATVVSYEAGLKIKEYIDSSSTPTAAIAFVGTVFGDKNAPMVTPFSSRGPNWASPGILKPDIIGPGASILAAWRPVSIDNNIDEKTATFNMISGTSMSCPHLSGVAALIKSAHPDWSPAMVKSAIMTSSTQMNLGKNPILDHNHQPADVFAIGAGHVNPPMALNPGLVYDISTDDYISYLCFLHTDQQVSTIVNKKINCSTVPRVPEAQLNYPSFSVILGYTGHGYSRTVTNVGEAESTYYARVESVPGVNVTVEPKQLSFTEVKQQLTYKVYFSRQEFTTNGSYVQGSIAWISTKHVVRIPVSVKLVL